MQEAERRALILGIVENQLRDNNPPETRATLERLMVRGIEREEALRLIGCVLAAEVFGILKHQHVFDLKRYVEHLHALPELPWEAEQS